MRAKQLTFEAFKDGNVKHFGGAYLKNSHPKGKRPISVKRPMHLVLRSLIAKGEYSLLKREKIIQNLILKQGKRFEVKIYRHANAGNHLHLVVLPKSREGFNRFIRSISGLIARAILGAERGKAQNLRFWEKRPFTRIIEWGRDYRGVCSYLLQNALEAVGFIPYQPRKYKLLPAPG